MPLVLSGHWSSRHFFWNSYMKQLRKTTCPGGNEPSRSLQRFFFLCPTSEGAWILSMPINGCGPVPLPMDPISHGSNSTITVIGVPSHWSSPNPPSQVIFVLGLLGTMETYGNNLHKTLVKKKHRAPNKPSISDFIIKTFGFVDAPCSEPP